MAVIAVYENHLVNDQGTPIVGATVNAYRVDTGALAASVLTQGATAGPPPKRAGYWKIGPLEDTLEYYIEAIVGTEKVVMGRWSGEMGTLKVFDRAILPALTTIGGANPILSTNIASQSVANAASLGGVAAANYSQTGHAHPYAQAASGHYTGGGSTNRLISLGFRPKHVVIQSALSGGAWARGEITDAPGVGFHSLMLGTDASGNLLHGFPYNTHFGPDATGFRVNMAGGSSLYTMNLSGVSYTWAAYA